MKRTAAVNAERDGGGGGSLMFGDIRLPLESVPTAQNQCRHRDRANHGMFVQPTTTRTGGI